MKDTDWSGQIPTCKFGFFPKVLGDFSLETLVIQLEKDFPYLGRQLENKKRDWHLQLTLCVARAGGSLSPQSAILHYNHSHLPACLIPFAFFPFLSSLWFFSPLFLITAAFVHSSSSSGGMFSTELCPLYPRIWLPIMAAGQNTQIQLVKTMSGINVIFSLGLLQCDDTCSCSHGKMTRRCRERQQRGHNHQQTHSARGVCTHDKRRGMSSIWIFCIQSSKQTSSKCLKEVTLLFKGPLLWKSHYTNDF